MLRRVLQHIDCISQPSTTCSKGLNACCEYSGLGGLLKVFGVTALFAELEPCSLSKIAHQHQCAPYLREDLVNTAHLASVGSSDQPLSGSSCSASGDHALCSHLHHVSTSSRSVPRSWDLPKRVSSPFTSRGFATLPKRAARKIAQRHGRPSSVVETDAQLSEEVSQSDSREVTETNEGKPSDVQVR